MFENDGLWPCKCRQCSKEWYASIAAIRADEETLCPYCDVRNTFHLPDFNRALAAARSGDYDFSYLERIFAAVSLGSPCCHGTGTSLARSMTRKVPAMCGAPRTRRR